MDKNSSFKYDASAQMDSMLDAYRASHGMKPKKSSGERIITVPVQPKSKPVQLDKEKLKESTEEAQKADYGICDINNSESVKDLVAKLPSLDGIVHCAGIDQRIPAKQVMAGNSVI